MSRWALGDRVAVRIPGLGPDDTTTGVVVRLPVGESPFYRIDVGDVLEDLYVSLDYILCEAPPVGASPAEMLEWLRS